MDHIIDNFANNCADFANAIVDLRNAVHAAAPHHHSVVVLQMFEKNFVVGVKTILAGSIKHGLTKKQIEDLKWHVEFWGTIMDKITDGLSDMSGKKEIKPHIKKLIITYKALVKGANLIINEFAKSTKSTK